MSDWRFGWMDVEVNRRIGVWLNVSMVDVCLVICVDVWLDKEWVNNRVIG